MGAPDRPQRVDFVAGPLARLAVVADVHGNTAALDAVLASAAFATVDAVAFLGCITTGPDPIGVLERCAAVSVPTYFLAGNGERAVIELADGARADDWPTGAWILERHGHQGVDTIRAWPAALSVEIAGLGPVRLCHGSPRSDIELLTPRTADDRIRAAMAGIDERVFAHGHTHLQYERTVGDVRIVAPGSVGMPYTEGPFGARWAILSADIDLRTTPYSLAEAQRRIRTIGYPDPRFLRNLETPLRPEDIVADAEARQFSE